MRWKNHEFAGTNPAPMLSTPKIATGRRMRLGSPPGEQGATRPTVRRRSRRSASPQPT
jgi:hypothetical protein